MRSPLQVLGMFHKAVVSSHPLPLTSTCDWPWASVEAIQTLVKGGMGLLIVEQNLGVATALAERQLVMATGRIVAETTGKALMNDPSAQRLYLGIGPSDPVAE